MYFFLFKKKPQQKWILEESQSFKNRTHLPHMANKIIEPHNLTFFSKEDWDYDIDYYFL